MSLFTSLSHALVQGHKVEKRPPYEPTDAEPSTLHAINDDVDSQSIDYQSHDPDPHEHEPHSHQVFEATTHASENENPEHTVEEPIAEG